ncbi:hypothetical protein HanRHA438_Chr08g0369371 [Helianthus annuus]|nr:hypothetical protein HanRHA438_Chr08g0369371 [Helianthus annuus]
MEGDDVFVRVVVMFSAQAWWSADSDFCAPFWFGSGLSSFGFRFTLGSFEIHQFRLTRSNRVNPVNSASRLGQTQVNSELTRSTLSQLSSVSVNTSIRFSLAHFGPVSVHTVRIGQHRSNRSNAVNSGPGKVLSETSYYTLV